MGDGTEKNPYTWEDVLRLIEGNGGKAEGLDLSGKTFTDGIDLSKLDLRGVILNEAKLFDAILNGTELEGAFLSGADIYQARLDEVNWGKKHMVGEEEEGKKQDFHSAVSIYRCLKVWYTQKGYSEIAGEFFFRQTEVKRKELCRFKPRSLEHWKLQGSYWIFGHGERWMRLFFGWIVGGILGIGLIYFLFRGVAPHTLSAQAFLNSLYYSAVSFTALGYGPWFSNTSVHSWVQWAGAAEAFIGVFLIALFLVTLIRKLAR